MQRRFRVHDVRQVDHLEGVWDFAFLGDVDPDTIDPQSLRFDDRMAVPGCFDATPGHAGRRGLVAYRRRVLFRDASPHRLVLDGVHHWCRVLLDGRTLTEHVGGFTRFHVDITGHAPGAATLVVLVDNRLDPARTPTHLHYYDWYHYGGITRGVELHRLGDCWIDDLAVFTDDFRARRVTIRVNCANAGAERRVPLVVSVAGETVVSDTLALPRGATQQVTRTVALPGLDLWSPDHPALHEVYVRLGDLDDRHERIGIRQVAVRGREILINDEPVRLLGFCRHEAHPHFGHAVPEQVMIGDLHLLKMMNCNFVRGSHYPQDVRFLDLCDEMGFCVWSEGIGWNNGPDHLTNEAFVGATQLNAEEMVADAINRPSVILWGVLNEGQSQAVAHRPTYERLLGRIREMDPSRPVTYASNQPWEDKCWDLADVLAVNTYPGWYVGELADIPARLDELTNILRKAGQDDKPFIISEIGGAATYGTRDWNRSRWSEEYQSDLLELVIRHLFETRDRACGIAIWQFNDMRTTANLGTVLSRARGFNNKGVLDEYRRPKLAFATVRDAFARLRRR